MVIKMRESNPSRALNLKARPFVRPFAGTIKLCQRISYWKLDSQEDMGFAVVSRTRSDFASYTYSPRKLVHCVAATLGSRVNSTLISMNKPKDKRPTYQTLRLSLRSDSVIIISCTLRRSKLSTTDVKLPRKMVIVIFRWRKLLEPNQEENKLVFNK